MGSPIGPWLLSAQHAALSKSNWPLLPVRLGPQACPRSSTTSGALNNINNHSTARFSAGTVLPSAVLLSATTPLIRSFFLGLLFGFQAHLGKRHLDEGTVLHVMGRGRVFGIVIRFVGDLRSVPGVPWVFWEVEEVGFR